MQFSEFPDQFFDVRQLVERVHPREGNPPRFVNNERGALADSGNGRTFPQNAELPGDFPVRIEIGAKRNPDKADFLLPPRDMTGNGIYADVQNLGIERLEFFAASVEFGHLNSSGGRPVEWMKRNNQVLPAEVVFRPHRDLTVASDGWKFESWSGISNFESHSFLSQM